MLKNKRLFIFANEKLSNRITNFFYVKNKLGFKRLVRFTYGYNTQNEFLNMIQRHEITNLYLADYFFIDYDYIKGHEDLLDILILNYPKPVICIFKNTEESIPLEDKISLKIFMDTFDQDLYNCVEFLSNINADYL